MLRRSLLGAAMEGGRRALWLTTVLASAIVLVSLNGHAAEGGQMAGSGPDNTAVMCVSKCGTCPTVCSSSPPPPPAASHGGSSALPTTPDGGSPPGQNDKGGHPSSYYYFFTAGSGRRSGPPSGGYAVALVSVLVSLAAGFP